MFTLVQSTGRGSGTNSFTRQFGVTPTAGNVIIGFLWLGAASSNVVDMDVTDDSGLITWKVGKLSASQVGARCKIVYAFNIPTLSSSPIITITRQGSVVCSLTGSFQEWSGFGTNDPFSAAASNTGGGTTSANSGTTAAVGELDALVVSMCTRVFNVGAITVESVTPAWSQEFQATFPSLDRIIANYRQVSAGGTQICHWTWSGADNYSACIVAFVSGNTPTAGVRGNQIASTVAAVGDPSPLRTNQIVQSLVRQAPPSLLWNQVVLTFIVVTPTACPPDQVPQISAAGEAGAPIALIVPVVPTCATPDEAPAVTQLAADAPAVSLPALPPAADCAAGAIELGPAED